MKIYIANFIEGGAGHFPLVEWPDGHISGRVGATTLTYEDVQEATKFLGTLTLVVDVGFNTLRMCTAKEEFIKEFIDDTCASCNHDRLFHTEKCLECPAARRCKRFKRRQ